MLRQLKPALERAEELRLVIYLSTVGVYGDHGGAWIDEETPLRPTNERGKRRVAAEEAWTAFGAARGFAVQAAPACRHLWPRPERHRRSARGTARRIIKEGQVFNRIHVEDIAGAALAGFLHPEEIRSLQHLRRRTWPAAGRGRACGLAPRRRAAACGAFRGGAALRNGAQFLFGKQALLEQRLKERLGYRLRHPTYREGLAAIAAAD